MYILRMQSKAKQLARTDIVSSPELACVAKLQRCWLNFLKFIFSLSTLVNINKEVRNCQLGIGPLKIIKFV